MDKEINEKKSKIRKWTKKLKKKEQNRKMN